MLSEDLVTKEMVKMNGIMMDPRSMAQMQKRLSWELPLVQGTQRL